MATNQLHTQLTIKANVDGANEVQSFATSLDAVNQELVKTKHASLASDALDALGKEAGQSIHQTNQLTQAIRLANSGLGNIVMPACNARDAVSGLSQSAEKSAKSLSNLDGAVNSLKGILATLGISVGAKELIELADGFSNLQARIKLATADGIAFENAMTAIGNIANSTGSDLTATAELFSKLTQATKDVGLNQQQVLEVTDTLSKAMQLSGGSAESMNAAITQLAQGLSAGALRGDELNSVMEQSPRIAQALADGLGVTIGQLRQMGQEGKLTAETVIHAMQSQMNVINQEFASLPSTVSSSLQTLKNSLQIFIGNLNNELSISSALSGFIKDIASGLNNLDPASVHAVKSAFSSLADTASQVMGLFLDVYHTLSSLGQTGEEQVGLLTQAVTSLNVGLGLLHDATAGIKVGFDALFGGILLAMGKTKEAFASLIGLINQDLAKQTQASAQALIDQANKLLDDAHNGALAFHSKTVQSLQDLNKSSQDIIKEQAQTAKEAFDKMQADGTHSTESLQASFAEYAKKAILANDGIIDGTSKQALAQKNLQAIIDDTGKVTITAMDNAQKAIDGIDLSSHAKSLQAHAESFKTHAESFKALGIDMGEFAGGLSSKINTALGAFNDLAKVAGSNVEQLAMAYNGAKSAIGDNAQGLAQLDKALSQAVDGSLGLAQGVKALAQEQQNAKNASDAQKQALQALGIEMSAINAGMSQSGYKMADNLKLAIDAISQSAISAKAFGAAINQALDTSLASAKTQNDFKAINQIINQAGLSAQIGSEHVKKLQLGIAGGIDAIKTASEAQKQATDKATQSLDAQSRANQSNTQSTQQNAEAKANLSQANQQLVDATDKASASIDRQQKSQQRYAQTLAPSVLAMREKVQALSQYGATAEQVTQIQNTMYQSITGKHKDFIALNHAIASVNQTLKDKTDTLMRAHQAVGKMTSSIEPSLQSIAKAQQAFSQATSVSINGIVQMDSTTLSNLQAQIDSARQKMMELEKASKSVADSLEVQYHQLVGNEKQARRLIQSQQLEQIKQKLSEAKMRQNAGEIAQYERALDLQQKIHQEQEKQAQTKAKTNQALAHGNQVMSASAPNTQVQANHTPKNMGTPSAKEVAQAFQDSIDQARRQAVQDFAHQLMDEAKRRAH